MTSNQIAYWQLQRQKAADAEIARSNVARETETQRSNMAKEEETARSNLAKEAETFRNNLVQSTETHRANVAKEAATSRQLMLEGHKVDILRDDTESKIVNRQFDNVAKTARAAKDAAGVIAQFLGG